MKRLIAAIAACTLGVVACSSDSASIVGGGAGGSSNGNKGGNSSTSTASTNKGGGSSSEGGSSQSSSTTKTDKNAGGTSSDSSNSTKSSNAGGSSSSSSNGSKATGGSSSSSSNKSAGGTSSTSSSTGTSSSKGGSTSSVGGTSSTGTSTASTTGGSTSTSSATSGVAGKGPIVCSNTDKTILPVDENGWVDKTCNSSGIQGGFYWYADKNTKANLKCGGAACEEEKPPWQSGSPGPGMCISGKTTGSSDDWGAGIGLGLNTASPDDSTKLAYDAAAAGVTGFDLTLTGNTNGMDIRIGFATSADGKTISPFIPVPDPAGKTMKLSGTDQILIKKAAIPVDWKSTDPSPPDPSKIYDLQVQVATDTAKAGTAFELCVTAIKPAGGTVGPTTPACKNTDGGTVSGTDVKAIGSYGMQANVNASTSGSATVHGYSGSGCAAIDVSLSGNLKGSGDAPAAYPSIINGWQWGHGFTGSYSQGSVKKVSDLKTVKTSMAFTSPAGNKWDVAYDIWLDTRTSIDKPDGNSVEVMVWLDYSTTTTTNAIGSKTGSFTAADGSQWEVWTGSNSGGWKVVSYRRTPSSAAVTDLDLLQFIKDSTVGGKGASTSMNLLGVQAGFELFDATSGGAISNYSLTIN